VKYSHQDHGRVTVMTLSGEYTSEDVDRFQRLIAERFASSIKDVVLDCEHLEFVDSAGLESWLRLVQQTADRRGQLRLVKVDSTVAKILEITRLNRTLQTHDTVEAAVRSLR